MTSNQLTMILTQLRREAGNISRPELADAIGYTDDAIGLMLWDKPNRNMDVFNALCRVLKEKGCSEQTLQLFIETRQKGEYYQKKQAAVS